MPSLASIRFTDDNGEDALLLPTILWSQYKFIFLMTEADNQSCAYPLGGHLFLGNLQGLSAQGC